MADSPAPGQSGLYIDGVTPVTARDCLSTLRRNLDEFRRMITELLQSQSCRQCDYAGWLELGWTICQAKPVRLDDIDGSAES